MYESCFARGGSCPRPLFPCIPADALKPAVCIDGNLVPGSFFGCVEWIRGGCEPAPAGHG